MKTKISAFKPLLLASLLVLAALPAAADSILFNNTNPSPTYNVNAYSINEGFSVTDSFTLAQTSTITGVTFVTWTSPGEAFPDDTVTSVVWAITRQLPLAALLKTPAQQPDFRTPLSRPTPTPTATTSFSSPSTSILGGNEVLASRRNAIWNSNSVTPSLRKAARVLLVTKATAVPQERPVSGVYCFSHHGV